MPPPIPGSVNCIIIMRGREAKQEGELASPLSFGLELTGLICPESGSLSVR